MGSPTKGKVYLLQEAGLQREIAVPASIDNLEVDGDETIAVSIVGKHVWTVLYAHNFYKGQGIVINKEGETDLPGKYNKWASSVRTINTEEVWRSIGGNPPFVNDEDRSYELKLTEEAEKVAEQVKEKWGQGNEKKCWWDELEVNFNDNSVGVRLYLRHKHKVAGNVVYSYLQKVIFVAHNGNIEGEISLEWDWLGNHFHVTIPFKDISSLIIAPGLTPFTREQVENEIPLKSWSSSGIEIMKEDES